MVDKPKVATLGEMAHDLEITLKQLQLEYSKHHPDKEVVDYLIWRAIHKSVAINGTLERLGIG